MSVLPKGRQWVAHCGGRARRRVLRQRCRAVLTSTAPPDVAVRARLAAATEGRRDGDYVALQLAAMALDVHEATQVPWADALAHLLDSCDIDVLYAEATPTVSTVAAVRAVPVPSWRRRVDRWCADRIARLERWRTRRRMEGRA